MLVRSIPTSFYKVDTQRVPIRSSRRLRLMLDTERLITRR